MISGSDVHWWGSPIASDFENGFLISDHNLNQTFNNASFIVHLLSNVTWDKLGFVSVWDLTTSSHFGHVLLSNTTESDHLQAPTMFDNCKKLSDNYRLRWSLNAEEGYVDIGLEAITGLLNYMAFGWAKPNSTSNMMMNANVVVTGIREDGFPFADDFYITKPSVCSVKDGFAHGVCPDSVNHTKLLYGHQIDGVSFVRYRRPLNDSDNKYDIPVNPTEILKVIWALGVIKPPDFINTYFLPEFHGGVESENYGNLSLNLSDHVDECLGPLEADNKYDQGVIIADANAHLLVTTGPYVHHPNPPNPSNVRVLRVERRVQVVNGGLSDIYNNSVNLDDDQVKFFWTIVGDSISIAARGETKSGYLSIGFGTEMANSYSYVGWFDREGTGHVNTYWIDGASASSIHPTTENMTYVKCKSEEGIMTLEFTRPLKPSCRGKPECKNMIDPTTPLKVIWAMGSRWTDGHLTERNMHSATSQNPVRVMLTRGSAEAEQALKPVLGVHGFMMFLAWGILLPGGILSARYLKHINGWFKIHIYLQCSGLAIVFLGLLFAVAELNGFYFSSSHVKFGFTAIVLACVQPMNALLRPSKPPQGDSISSKRLIWEYSHSIIGQSALIIGVIGLFTGMKQLGERNGADNVDGLNLALWLWLFLAIGVVGYLEFRERGRRRRRNMSRGNVEEDSLMDSRGGFKDDEENRNRGGRLEIQLEPLKL